MYVGSPGFWLRKSVTDAVRDLAGKSLLGFYGHDHTFLWSALAQTGETDWVFANSLANKIGWRLWSRYGCLLLFDPLKLFTESGSYCRLFTGTPEDYSTDRVLLEFMPNEVEESSIKTRGTRYGYFTSAGVPQVVETSGEHDTFNFKTDLVIADQDAATAYVDADRSDLDTWKQSAIARIWGDADIYPGMCVDVQTTNRRYMRNKFDGKWLVRASSHKMDRQQYQTLLYLVRPASTTAAGIGSYTPFWRITDISAAKPSLSINEGKWLSSKANRTVAAALGGAR
jgi:phage protein D